MVWVLWTNAKGNDVYLAARMLGGIQKVSLHGSGKWRIAFDDPESPFIPAGEDRATTKWDRPAELTPGWTRAFAVVIPASEVVRGKAVIRRPHQVYWAAKPEGDAAVEFNLFISAPHVTSLREWPGRDSMGTRPVFRAALGNGEHVWLLEQVVDIPASARQQFEDHRGRIMRFYDESDLDWSDGDPRGFFLHTADDGTPAFTDLALPLPNR